MKKLLLSVVALGALCSCVNENEYTIKGQIEGLPEMVYLLTQEGVAIDSAKVVNGEFTFNGIVEQPSMNFVADFSDPQQRGSFIESIFLEPGDIVITDGEEPQQRTVKGTPANDARDIFMSAMRPLMGEYRSAETSPERRTAILSEWEQLVDSSIEKNRNNLFGVALFADNKAGDLSLEVLQAEIAKFSPEMQQLPLIAKVREQAAIKSRTSVGKDYIDVVQHDKDGKEVSLKSVLEKEGTRYVLLDFWASWCGPCMGEVPHLKKTYDEFHKQGFEIFGVSFDKDRDEWLKAVDNKKMNWVHVSELQGFKNQAAQDYAIQGIPSNFLIDKEGKIVALHLRGEALYEKVKELLSK